MFYSTAAPLCVRLHFLRVLVFTPAGPALQPLVYLFTVQNSPLYAHGTPPPHAQELRERPQEAGPQRSKHARGSLSFVLPPIVAFYAASVLLATVREWVLPRI